MKIRIDDPRISAIVVLCLGTVVTIGANILHASPSVWAKLLSASVPLILFFTAHTVAYTKSFIVRWTMLPVAGVALAISYDHMNALAMRYEESYAVAKLYPLAIDGAMIVAQLTLAVYRQPESAEDEQPLPQDGVLSLLGNAEVVDLAWPDGALLLVAEAERVSLVRKEINRARKEQGQKPISQNSAEALVRNYLKENVR